MQHLRENRSFATFRPLRFASTLSWLQRPGMMAESAPLDFHERIKRQGAQNLMQLAGVLDVEDADVRVFARDPPQVPPLTLSLQFLRPVVLAGGQIFDFFRLDLVRNPDRDVYVEQHIHSSMAFTA